MDRQPVDEQVPAHGTPLPSLRTNSAARFGAEAAGVILATIGGAITARWLGTGGKGTLATLLYLTTLSVEIAAFGLGDAATILMGQRKATLQQATSSTVVALAASSLTAMAILAISATALLGTESETVRWAILVAVLMVPLESYSTVLGIIVNSRERIVATSIVFVANRALSVIGLVIFVVALSLSITGGLLAPAIASACAAIAMARLIRRMGVSLRPRLIRTYLDAALRLGAAVQASYLVIALSQRLDQLLIYGIAGRNEAGIYSVALTVGQLVVYAPIAISFAAYPRVARLDESEVSGFTALMSRLGIAAALVSALVLAVLIPIAIPVLYGDAFRPAVVPALVLVVSGVLYSTQWILSRAAAARGATGLLFGSFGASLVAMILADIWLIPILGPAGAALGALASHLFGLIICLRFYRRRGGAMFRLRDLFPTLADFRALGDFWRRLLTQGTTGPR